MARLNQIIRESSRNTKIVDTDEREKRVGAGSYVNDKSEYSQRFRLGGTCL